MFVNDQVEQARCDLSDNMRGWAAAGFKDTELGV